MTAMAGQPIVELSQRYRDQFATTFDTLRNRSTTLAQDAQERAAQLQSTAASFEPVVRNKQQQIVAALSDVSPVTPAEPRTFQLVLETYLWASVCLVGVTAGRLLGGVLFAPLLGLVFDSYVAAGLAYVLLPAHYYYYNRKSASEGVSEDDRRMLLFALSTCVGLLDGFLCSECYMTSASPPAFIMPAVLGLMAEIAGDKTANNRPAFLGAIIGAGVAAYLIVGVVVGLSFSYLLSTVALAGVTAVSVQIMLAQLKAGGVDMLETQLAYVASVVFTQAVLTFLLSTTKEKMDAAAASAASDAK